MSMASHTATSMSIIRSGSKRTGSALIEFSVVFVVGQMRRKVNTGRNTLTHCTMVAVLFLFLFCFVAICLGDVT